MELSELGFFLEEELFLIGDEAEVETAPQIEVENIVIYGENKKGILCLISYEGDFNKSKEYTLLLKIMEATKHTLYEFGILNLLENEGLTYPKLKAKLATEQIILFGELPIEGIPKINSQNAVASADGKQWIKTAPLIELLQDRDKKVHLWNALKALFNI